ncbi:MAG TPA: DUF327 domain-containing protein [Clostridiales bacterium]|nr:DUF327 domain-containing protein [Clostridiales bacterium]
MDIQKIRKADGVSSHGVGPMGSGSGGQTSRGFQNAFHEQFKKHYSARACALFDEIRAQAPKIAERADIGAFERYRGLIRDLLNEVVNNAYLTKSERILDSSGRHRIYTTMKIVDSKLDSLASDLLDKNGSQIGWLSRIDEIRGLVMDLFY